MSRNRRTESAEDGEASGGRKKLWVLAAVAVVAVAVAAWALLLSGGPAEAQEPVPGEMLTLEPVAVNLAGGGYLKVGLALQLTEDAAGHGGGPDGARALDLVISTFSQAQPADVMNARDALKAALEQKIVEAYHGDVMAIYYTEYVAQ